MKYLIRMIPMFYLAQWSGNLKFNLFSILLH